jgi:predicted dehydrogenase
MNQPEAGRQCIFNKPIQEKESMGKDKLRIGIIGCGGIAIQKHFPALSKLTDLCEMVAFCDVKKDRATKAAKDFGTSDATVYTNHKEILKDKSIDVVHILTPNVSHCPITLDAFAAKKHVLCEKPMAHTTTDAKKMLDAAKRSGKKFTIAYQNRFRDEVQTLHRACSSGALGDIYFAKAHAVRRRAVPTWGVFMDKAQQGGGPLIDIGTHALDMTLWMMNNYKPRSVSGSVFYKMADKVEGNIFGPWDPSTYDVEDSAFGFIKMENGATIFLESSWILNTTDAKEAATTLCGTGAGAEITGDFGAQAELTINGSKFGKLFIEKPTTSGGVAYFDANKEAPGDIEAKQWLLSIINDDQPLVRPEEAFVVTQILDAIYRSHKTGREIFLNR